MKKKLLLLLALTATIGGNCVAMKRKHKKNPLKMLSFADKAIVNLKVNARNFFLSLSVHSSDATLEQLVFATPIKKLMQTLKREIDEPTGNKKETKKLQNLEQRLFQVMRKNQKELEEKFKFNSEKEAEASLKALINTDGMVIWRKKNKADILCSAMKKPEDLKEVSVVYLLEAFEEELVKRTWAEDPMHNVYYDLAFLQRQFKKTCLALLDIKDLKEKIAADIEEDEKKHNTKPNFTVEEALKKIVDGSTQNYCQFCQSESKSRCSGCQEASYCSSKCQKSDWATHKHFCVKK